MKKLPGFSLIELLVVMAITGSLVALSVGGLQGFSANNSLNVVSSKILSTLDKTRNYSLSSETFSPSTDLPVIGYIYTQNTSGSQFRYCVYEWYDNSTVSPQSSGYVYNGNLTTLASASTPIKINTANADCSQTSLTAGNGYTELSSEALSTQGIAISSGNNYLGTVSGNSVKYIAFENVTGKAFAFDASGNFINSNSTLDVITSANMLGTQYTKNIYIPLLSATAPYIS